MMLFINSEDIDKCLVKTELMDQMEEAMCLFESGEVNMPQRTNVTNNNDSLLFMPCFGKEYFSTKLVTVFPGNHGSQHPVVNGIVILNDVNNGSPVAVIDGQKLTGVRTGAVGSLGARHFSSPAAEGIGLVGAGAQGFYQILFSAAAHAELTGNPIDTVHIFDRDSDKSEFLADKLKPELAGSRIKIAKSVEELLEASQSVVLATASNNPVLPDVPKLLEGKCIVGIGSYTPEMQEMPRSAFELAERMFLDTSHAANESGDVINPLKNGWIDKSRVQTLGSLLIKREGTKEIEASKNLRGKTVIYKSVGMAVFDLMAAVYFFNHTSGKS